MVYTCHITSTGEKLGGEVARMHRSTISLLTKSWILIIRSGKHKTEHRSASRCNFIQLQEALQWSKSHNAKPTCKQNNHVRTTFLWTELLQVNLFKPKRWKKERRKCKLVKMLFLIKFLLEKVYKKQTPCVLLLMPHFLKIYNLEFSHVPGSS